MIDADIIQQIEAACALAEQAGINITLKPEELRALLNYADAVHGALALRDGEVTELQKEIKTLRDGMHKKLRALLDREDDAWSAINKRLAAEQAENVKLRALLDWLRLEENE